MTGEGTDDLRDWASEVEILKHSTQPNYKSLQACAFSVKCVHLTFIISNELLEESFAPTLQINHGPGGYSHPYSTMHPPIYALIASPSPIYTTSPPHSLNQPQLKSLVSIQCSPLLQFFSLAIPPPNHLISSQPLICKHTALDTCKI